MSAYKVGEWVHLKHPAWGNDILTVKVTKVYPTAHLLTESARRVVIFTEPKYVLGKTTPPQKDDDFGDLLGGDVNKRVSDRDAGDEDSDASGEHEPDIVTGWHVILLCAWG